LSTAALFRQKQQLSEKKVILLINTLTQAM